jgi:hypothetical protein
MNKKGIELSINFLVMLILGLVLLGGALYIGLQLFDQAQSTVEQSQASAQKELEQAQCSQLEVSCVVGNHKKLAKGTTGFVGIVLDNTQKDSSATYSITSVTLVKAYDLSDQEITSASSQVTVVHIDSVQPSRVAGPQESAKLALYLTPSKKAQVGQYIYEAVITQTLDDGSSTQQTIPITIRVSD